MTTIVMVETDSGVDIAYDSLCSAGNHAFEIDNRKVFKSGAMTIGVAGSISDLVTISTHNFSDTPSNSAHADQWVVNRFIPELKQALTDAGRMGENEGKKTSASLVLAVVHGRVYDIDGDFAWSRRTDHTYVIGSGEMYARGALSAGATPLEALTIAAKHDAWTGGTLRTAKVQR